jgi:hypothetical protein
MAMAAAIRGGVVIPALTRLKLYTLSAEKLLMGTAAVESRFVFRHQLKGGPALGLFQMEPPTFNWLLTEFLAARKHAELRQNLLLIAGNTAPTFNDLVTNDLFAAAMARIRYYAVHAPIPQTVAAQADYWWVHYNGRSPHGLKPADYLERWNQFCAPLYATQQNPAPQSSGLVQSPIWV